MATATKRKKAPAAKAAGFVDKAGHALAVGDRVLYEHPTSLHSGNSGTINAIHEREGDTPAIASVLLDKLTTWKEAPTIPAAADSLVWVATPDVMPAPAPAPIQPSPELPWLDSKGQALAKGDFVQVLGSSYGDRTGVITCLEAPLADDMSPCVWVDFPETPHDTKVSDIFLPEHVVRQEPVAAAHVEVVALPQPAPKAAGLNLAMVGEMADAYKVGLRLVLLASIVVTTNTRKVFDEAALAELAESVRAHGILQPIVLRPHPTESGKYELVAGGRRYRAAQLAELVEVPATVRNLTDREFLEVQLLENLQRVDVRPADEASAFAKLLSSNFSAEEIAQRVGKPVKFVLQRAKLANLVPFWTELLEQDKLLLVAANLIARLPAHSQVVVRKAAEKGYSWALKGGGLSLEQVKSIIASEVQRELTSACFPKDDAMLYPQAGACLTCPKRSSANASLFDDVATGKDNCLDAPCFNEKKRLYVQRRIVELTVGKEKPLLISNQTWETKTRPGMGMVYGSGKWNPSKEGEQNAIYALIVDGVQAGSQTWIKFSGIKSPEQEEKEKEQAARQLRAEREAFHHRELIANKLSVDMERDLYSEGPIAHSVLERFLVEKLTYGHSVVPKEMLDYLATNYSWVRPTADNLKNAWAERDEQTQRTPHYQYLYDQLERMTVRNKLHLWFALHFRSNLAGGYSSTQTALAKHIGTGYGYDTLEADAKKLVQERYYSKGKKQEATA
jgi:ParB/RepB/Spo0J family partition protein